MAASLRGVSGGAGLDVGPGADGAQAALMHVRRIRSRRMAKGGLKGTGGLEDWGTGGLGDRETIGRLQPDSRVFRTGAGAGFRRFQAFA